jgi:hypothetical protein
MCFVLMAVVDLNHHIAIANLKKNSTYKGKPCSNPLVLGGDSGCILQENE